MGGENYQGTRRMIKQLDQAAGKCFKEVDAVLLTMRRRIDALEAVTTRGFFGRLRWLLVGK